MTEREAIEMALDLIESEFTTKGENKYSPDEVIEALRQALAQPSGGVEQLGGLWIDGVAMKPSDMEAIAKTWMAAQPKQEPVAWMKDIGNGKYVDMVKPVGGFYGMCIPLYPHPPQRQWVGLTDEEKSDIWYVVTNRYFVTEDTHVYADAIEAKLKEKNI